MITSEDIRSHFAGMYAVTSCLQRAPKRFHYKCPTCKKHFKIMHRRSTFLVPGEIECFKCNPKIAGCIQSKFGWEHLLPAAKSRCVPFHMTDKEWLKQYREKKRLYGQ